MQVSKSVVVGAAVAFTLLIAVVGFLLGRESRRPRIAAAAPPAAAEPIPAVMPTANPPPAPAQPPTAASVASPTVAAPAPPPAPAFPTATSPASVPPPPPAASTDPAIEIRDYFVQMASIQAAGPAGDPTEMANKLLAAAVGGDSSGFDALIKDVDSGIARAQQLRVPSACQDYHQKMLALLGESGTMLRTLKSSIASKDTSGLTSLAASASSLQTRTDALAAEGRQIKARFGLPN